MSVKKQVKRKLVELSKKHKLIRIAFKHMLHFYRTLKYIQPFFQNKVEDNTILFESFMGRSYADSPKAMYEYMISDDKYKNYKYIWAFKHPKQYHHLLDNKNTTIIKYTGKEYYKTYSKSKYWISNSRIPEHIIKKKNQLYIQTWHGTPLKRLGYDIEVEGGNALNSVDEIRGKYLEDAKKMDYLLSPSKYCTEKLTSAFNLKDLNKENIVIEKGYPRNDKLYSYTPHDITDIRKKLNINNNKKLILYAPTWRDNEHDSSIGYVYKIGLDINNLYKTFKDEYVILFRAHYFAANHFDFEKHKDFIVDVSKYDDVNDLYIISDLLITDYSSTFFDYTNLNKPVLFYMYDLKQYEEELRGFYIDIKELPGPIAQTEKELINNIKNINEINKEYKKTYLEFKNKYNYLDSKDSSKKVVEYIFGSKED